MGCCDALVVMTDERDALRKQRDELLAALDNIMNMPCFNGTSETSKTRRDAKRAARAAIASVKEI